VLGELHLPHVLLQAQRPDFWSDPVVLEARDQRLGEHKHLPFPQDHIRRCAFYLQEITFTTMKE
jgi:hypothetical protein